MIPWKVRDDFPVRRAVVALIAACHGVRRVEQDDKVKNQSYAGFHSRRWSLIKVAVRNIVELGVDEGVNDPRLLMRRRVNEVFFSTRRHIITRTLVASKQCKQQEAQRHPWDKDSNTHPQGIYFNCSFDLETGYREKDPKISSARVSHNTTLSRVRGGSSSASSGAFRTGCLPR